MRKPRRAVARRPVCLDLLGRPPRRVHVQLCLVDPTLAVGDRLAGRIELGPLALQALLGRGQLPLGSLALPGALLALSPLGGLAFLGIGLPGRRGWGGRTHQPDRGGAPLPIEPAQADRLGHLGIGRGGSKRLADAGEDLFPDAVLASDRRGGVQQRIDRLLLAARRLAEPGPPKGA